MNFVPPPRADDVAGDLGPYSRNEVIMARRTLLHTMDSSQQSVVLQRLQNKLGILPNGQRLPSHDPEPSWIPRDLPAFWSAPVILHPPENEVPGMSSGDAELEQRGSPGRVPWGSGAVIVKSQNAHATSCHSQLASSSLSPSPIAVGSESERGGGNRSCGNTDMVCCNDPKVSESSSVQSKSPASDRKPHEPEGGSDEAESVRTARHPSMSQGDGDITSFETNENVQGVESCAKYVVMFQCDLCTHRCVGKESMMEHLRNHGHHSASRYLGLIDIPTGKLQPRYLSCVSLLKDKQSLFKHKIPVCPKCHAVFSAVSHCVQHCEKTHQAEGMYSLRRVIKSEMLPLSAECDRCSECGASFDKNELRQHILKTKHMPMYNRKKGRKTMMCFPCHFCQVIHTNYFTYKQHVFSKHATQASADGTMPGTSYTLSKGQAAQRLLPKDPGIPGHKINYNISTDSFRSVPGASGLWSRIKRPKPSSKKSRVSKSKHLAGLRAAKSGAATNEEGCLGVSAKKRKEAKAGNKKKTLKRLARRKRAAEAKKRQKQDARN